MALNIVYLYLIIPTNLNYMVLLIFYSSIWQWWLVCRAVAQVMSISVFVPLLFCVDSNSCFFFNLFLWQLFWFVVSFPADLQATTKRCYMEFKREWKPSDFRGSESKLARYIWSFLHVWFTCFIGFDSGTNTLLQHLQITDKRTCWHGNAGGRLNADPQNVVRTQPAISVMSSKCCADI